MIDPARFLEDLSGRYSHEYEDAMLEMAVAIATGNRVALAKERERLNNVINDTMGIAEVIGATMALQDAAPILPREGLAMKADTPYLMAFATQNLIPRISLKEAVEDMVDRVPYTLRRAADRTAQRISELYSTGHPITGRPIIAFARSAEAKVTNRVHELMAQILREGGGEVEAGRTIVRSVAQIRKKSKPWTQSYARMAFRTNCNTAIAAGKFRQIQDPDVKRVIPCFAFTTSNDADVRDNHKKLNGLIFKVDNMIWNDIAPPLGYNCRCKVRNITRPMLRRMGRLSVGGTDNDILEDYVSRAGLAAGFIGADKNFRHGGRPDLFVLAQSR